MLEFGGLFIKLVMTFVINQTVVQITTSQQNKKPSENLTNEKLGGRNLVETQGTLETGLMQTPSTVALPWIIVFSVIGSIIVIGLITFLAVLRSKRRATGTYR